MSTAASLAPPPVAPAVPPRAVRVWINEDIPIPAEVVDHESYRRWARSDDFPQQGRFAFLNGTIWVDLSMEKLYSHNQIKHEYSMVLGTITKSDRRGRFIPDGMLLSHPGAGLSTEPDGAYASFEAFQSGRVRRIEAVAGTDYIELEGSPEMTLEVVSDTSVRKDTIDLFDLYWRAGVSEYWLVDAREEAVAFTIFKRGRKGYVAVRHQKGGWLKSNVFGRSFRLTQSTDPLGGPQYTLEVRS
jgi:Uma2 family endonuclease